MDGRFSLRVIAGKITILTLLCLSLWLALSTFNAARSLSAGVYLDQLGWYAPIPQLEGKKLDARKEEILRRLDFMVWERERHSLVRELSSILRRQINAEPFDPYLWQSLSGLYGYDGISTVESAWIWERALVLNRWNDSERSTLTHHCINRYEEFKELAPQLCLETLKNVPKTPNSRYLAQEILRVKHSRMQEVLAKEGLSFEDINQ